MGTTCSNTARPRQSEQRSFARNHESQLSRYHPAPHHIKLILPMSIPPMVQCPVLTKNANMCNSNPEATEYCNILTGPQQMQPPLIPPCVLPHRSLRARPMMSFLFPKTCLSQVVFSFSLPNSLPADRGRVTAMAHLVTQLVGIVAVPFGSLSRAELAEGHKGDCERVG